MISPGTKKTDGAQGRTIHTTRITANYNSALTEMKRGSANLADQVLLTAAHTPFGMVRAFQVMLTAWSSQRGGLLQVTTRKP